MRIVQDKVEGEKFIDICMTAEECESIKEYNLLSIFLEIDGIPVNLGIKIDVEGEEDEW